MSVRFLTWNLNHRAKAKAIPSTLADVISSQKPDLIVLTEYVHGAARRPFLDQLTERGLPHWRVSHVTPLKENHILVASRTPIEAGSVQAPSIAPSVPSNFLHVILPQEGCEILGLRVPDYSKQPKMQRACWEWIIETAKTVKDRPFVLIGDFNLDPRYPQTVCGDCIGRLIDDGWQLASPKEGASYWTLKDKVPCQIDHALVSRHFTILDSKYVSDFGGLGFIGVSKHALSDHAILWIDIERRESRAVTSEPSRQGSEKRRGDLALQPDPHEVELGGANRRSDEGETMTYEELVDFIEHRMTMSHVYQPVLIRSLVDAGGKATLRQLAQAFLVQDESQLLYYEDRIKKMPFPVLRKHGVVERDGDLVCLTTKKLTLQQKAHVRMLCEKRLQEFVTKRGPSVWDYRLLESDPVPDSLRYEVLKAANDRCALCGVSKKERPLQVDHIKPRPRGGTNAIENLQALCDECNRAKSNRDTTDFRIETETQAVADCDFCEPKIGGRIVEDRESVIAIQDKYPVSQGHLLVLPRRHTPDLFGMVERERIDANNLLRILKTRIQRQDATVTGFNVGRNCGEDAGQTVMHAHIHLIPRRRGDTAKPQGGVRGVIPDRMAY